MRTRSTLTGKFQRGFSLVEVMGASAIVIISGLAISQLAALQLQGSSRDEIVRVAASARHEIEAAVKNPLAWSQTTLRNPSFACASNAPGCDPTVVNPLVLYSSVAGEKLTYDATDGTSRTHLKGGRCPAGVPDPSGICPFKFTAQWRAICPTAAPCLYPTIEIQTQLTTNDFSGLNPNLNSELYSLATVRPFVDSSLASSCAAVNGVYNATTRTCIPKYAGRNCTAQGEPYKVVAEVNADGSIVCRPPYTGSCNAATEVMSGVSPSGVASCSPKVCNCKYTTSRGACSALCGAGTRAVTYTIIRPPLNGGLACPIDGTEACNNRPCPIDCVGGWSGCDSGPPACGPGTQTFMVSTPAQYGGVACSASNGDTQACSNAPCGPPVAQACAGYWSPCDKTTGFSSFIVTTAPANGGAACPASPVACAVACEGAWDTCSVSFCGSGTQTYRVNVTAKNGGAACPHATDDTQNCTSPCVTPCVGSFGTCSATCGGGTRTYSITAPAQGGGTACPHPDGYSEACNPQACGTDCVGSFGACSAACGGGKKTFTITTPAANGGAACSNNDGDQIDCNSAPCGPDTNCGGTWSACNPGTGTQTFTITQAPQGSGTACPASPRTCAVDCIGSWSTCASGTRTYSITQAAQNGGLSCPFTNGQTNTSGCPPLQCTQLHPIIWNGTPPSIVCAEYFLPLGGAYTETRHNVGETWSIRANYGPYGIVHGEMYFTCNAGSAPAATMISSDCQGGYQP